MWTRIYIHQIRCSGKGATYDFFIGGALHKPDGFPVDKPVTGFLLSYQL